MLVTFLQFLISDTNCIDIKNDNNGKLWPQFVIRVVKSRDQDEIVEGEDYRVFRLKFCYFK